MSQPGPLCINSFWKAAGASGFDFIIDDRLHTFEGGSTLFLNSIGKLSINGIIIEDVPLFDLIRSKEFFNNYKYIVEYLCSFGPSPRKTGNNQFLERELKYEAFFLLLQAYKVSRP